MSKSVEEYAQLVAERLTASLDEKYQKWLSENPEIKAELVQGRSMLWICSDAEGEIQFKAIAVKEDS